MTQTPEIWYRRIGEKPLCVLRGQRDACLRVIRNERSSFSELEPLISRDATLTVLLLSQVNQLRRKQPQGVAAIGTALSLMGLVKLEAMLRDAVVLEEWVPDERVQRVYKRLLLRAHHAAVQARRWGIARNDWMQDELYVAALIHPLAELALCAYDFPAYRQIRYRMCEAGTSSSVAARAVLGFGFDELGVYLSQVWQLPDPLPDSFAPADVFSHRSIGVLLAGETARAAERGWYTPTMHACVEAVTDMLGRDESQVVVETHRTAVDAARSLVLEGVRPAAAWLIMPEGDLPCDEDVLPEPEQGAEAEMAVGRVQPPVPRSTPQAPQQPPPPLRTTKPAVGASQEKPSALALIRHAASAPEVLKGLVTGLGQDGTLKRVVLALLGQDRQCLGVRLSKGLAQDAALKTAQISLDKTALLQQLLKKPAALWVNEGNYLQYAQGLPAVLLDSCKSRQFFLMSLFVGQKPIGIVCADAEGTALDMQDYERFKRSCAAASKALADLQRAAVEARDKGNR